LRHDFFGYDEGGHTSTLPTGHVTFSRRLGMKVCAGDHGAGVMKKIKARGAMPGARPEGSLDLGEDFDQVEKQVYGGFKTSSDLLVSLHAFLEGFQLVCRLVAEGCSGR